jgi:CelD/BcsL family acetyltransferase involved in cellulose biosynthesis
LDERQAVFVGSQDGCRIVRRASESPYMTLANEEDVLRYMPAEQRRTLVRRMRRYGDNISFRMGGDELLDTMIAVERQSYRSRRRMAFFAHESSVRFIRALAEHVPGSVRIGILSFNHRPIAAVLGFVHSTVFSWCQIAFAEQYRYIGPGKMVLYLLMTHLRREGYVDIDLLRGNSELKRQFTERFRIQYDAYLSTSLIVAMWWRVALAIWNSLKYVSVQLRKYDAVGRVIKPSYSA